MEPREATGSVILRARIKLGLFLLAAGILSGVGKLSAAPEIGHFVPHAVKPGETTVLTFSGSRLKNASNLWTSFGGRARRVPNTNEGLISFSVSCPPEASGIHALQLGSPEGASGFQLVMVDALDTQPHRDEHRKPESAHKIVPPMAVDCILRSEQIDYYKFHAKAGERFSIEVIAHRIGSQMDPVARVLDAKGEELSFCDDEGSVWKDARFSFKAPKAGEYTLAVHDVGYGGGNAFDYRLRVTDEPLVWFTYPLADPQENSLMVEQVGDGRAISQPGSPANPFARVGLSAVAQVVESEPNDEAAAAQLAAVPSMLHGRIQNGTDVDVFRFEVAKDEKLVFQSQTRSVGSPCDLALTLRKASGELVARSDFGNPGDAALTNTFSEAGSFLLEVRELSGNTISNAPYRIRIERARPGFVLSLENNVLNVKAGGEAKVKVSAKRYDFEGAIQLAFEPEIPGLKLENNSIAEKKNETELTLRFEEGAPEIFTHVKLIGRAEGKLEATASTAAALKKSFSLMLNPPTVLDEVVAVSCVGK